MSNTWFVFERLDDHSLIVVKAGSKEYDKLWKQDSFRVLMHESFTTRQAARNAIANKEVQVKSIRKNFLQRCIAWVKHHFTPMDKKGE